MWCNWRIDPCRVSIQTTESHGVLDQEGALLGKPTTNESNEATLYFALLRLSQDMVIEATPLGTETTTGIGDSGAHTYLFACLGLQVITPSPEKSFVGVIMGSDSDLPVMFPAARILGRFQIPYEPMNVFTHRMLGWLVEYLAARGVEKEVLIWL